MIRNGRVGERLKMMVFQNQIAELPSDTRMEVNAFTGHEVVLIEIHRGGCNTMEITKFFVVFFAVVCY